MRKIQILGLALFAVFAFSAVAATAAFAENEWLVERNPVATPLASETAGELELIKLVGTKTAEVLIVILCNGILDGTIGPGSTDQITALLPAGGGAAITLAGAGLSCTVETTGGADGAADCKLGILVQVWAENLPWNTLILLNGANFIDDLEASSNGEPGYTVSCETNLGITGEETCTGNTFAELSNEALSTPPAVLGMFGASQPLAKCTLTGAESAELKGDGNTWAVEGATRLETAVS